jgi:serine/threonine protein kinase
MTEIELMKFCNHKNIISYIDNYEDENTIYIVQEYMNKGDLFNYLRREVLMDEKKIKTIIIQIAEGLKYLHEYGIIHRDLKPHNIIVCVDGSSIIAKICDFGLSKYIGVNGKGKGSSGTLHFTSPEVFSNNKYTSKVDVWSLGVVLYFLLFGILPFEDEENSKNVEKKICKACYKIPDSRTVSEDVKILLKACLEKEAEKRINISDFIDHKWFS